MSGTLTLQEQNTPVSITSCHGVSGDFKTHEGGMNADTADGRTCSALFPCFLLADVLVFKSSMMARVVTDLL